MSGISISKFSSLNFEHNWKLDFQVPAGYAQKFLTTDDITVQYTVTDDLIPYYGQLTIDGQTTTVPSTLLYDGGTYKVYEILMNNLAEGAYIFDLVRATATPAKEFSTGFCVFEELEHSLLFRYSNYRNEKETIFKEGEHFYFRVEGIIHPQEVEYLVETEDFRDQRYALTQLSAYPYKTQVITLGGPFGVPNWVAEKVNLIFSCTEVFANGIPYVRSDGSAPSRVLLAPGFPLYNFKLTVETDFDKYSNSKDTSDFLPIVNEAGEPVMNEAGHQLFGIKQ